MKMLRSGVFVRVLVEGAYLVGKGRLSLPNILMFPFIPPAA